ncbi:hypothetical protein ACF0H5_014879 [Mactra antiquata]
MSSFCEHEFMLKNFWFHHTRPVIFVTPQFGPQVLYPAWTILQLIYHIIAISIDAYHTAKHDGEPSGNYFLYMSNWTYLLLVISNIVDCSITLYVHCLSKYILEEREQKKTDASVVMRNKTVRISFKTMGEYYTMKGYLKVSWFFFTLSTVTGLTVSLLYWTFHFIDLGLDVGINLNGSKIGENTLDYGTLAFNFINALVILINLFITAKPFRLLHFYIPMIYFAVYFIFSVIYQAGSGDYIYKIFDWGQVFVTTGLTYGIVFIAVPLVHLMVFGLVQLRTKIGTVIAIKYAYSKWKIMKVLPLEPEVGKNTSVIRWITSQTSPIPEENFLNKEMRNKRGERQTSKDEEQLNVFSESTIVETNAVFPNKFNKTPKQNAGNKETVL